MPLAGTGDALGSAIAGILSGLSEPEKADAEVIWQKIGTALVAHIIANAVVTTVGGPATQTGPIS